MGVEQKIWLVWSLNSEIRKMPEVCQTRDCVQQSRRWISNNELSDLLFSSSFFFHPVLSGNEPVHVIVLQLYLIFSICCVKACPITQWHDGEWNASCPSWVLIGSTVILYFLRNYSFAFHSILYVSTGKYQRIWKCIGTGILSDMTEKLHEQAVIYRLFWLP